MRYGKYKDIGVGWIGKIPDSWELNKGKYIYSICTGKLDANEYVEDGKYPFFTCSNENLWIDTFAFDCEALLVSGNGNVGFTRYYNGRFNAYQRVYVISNFAEKINSNYLKYYTSSLLISSVENNAVGSVIEFIKLGDIKNFIICIPSAKEQEKIVNYLDDKTSKIDSIIKDLESEKDKLEVYKMELIAKVITKGLDENIPMKDSGVDWIGEVPEHWEVEKIKWVFKILKRQNGRDDRPVLSITQQGIKIKDIENNDGQMAESYEDYQLVEPGDFAMNSMDLLTGWIDCSQYEGVTSPDYRVFRLIDINDHNNDFYNYLFQMCYKRRIFYRIGQGVSNLGRWRLQREPFLNMKIPVPPKEEQENISNFIRIKENKINVIVNEVEKQIEKLKEYRKILIHEAVTGKLKIDGGSN